MLSLITESVAIITFTHFILVIECLLILFIVTFCVQISVFIQLNLFLFSFMTYSIISFLFLTFVFLSLPNPIDCHLYFTLHSCGFILKVYLLQSRILWYRRAIQRCFFFLIKKSVESVASFPHWFMIHISVFGLWFSLLHYRLIFLQSHCFCLLVEVFYSIF